MFFLRHLYPLFISSFEKENLQKHQEIPSYKIRAIGNVLKAWSLRVGK